MAGKQGANEILQRAKRDYFDLIIMLFAMGGERAEDEK